MDLSSPAIGTFYWAYGVFATVLGVVGIFMGSKSRSNSLRLASQVDREKKRTDQLANFVIPIGLSFAAETDFSTLLEKILIEGKALSKADGGTLYLMTPEKTLRFVMVINDSLKIAMGGTSGQPVSLAPLNLYDLATGEPNLKNISTACALGGNSLSVVDAYDAPGYDFSGTRAFDQLMNYRTISVLCVPLKDPDEQVIGVLQLINAHDPETRRVIPFDEHLNHIVGLLGLLAAAALKSYLRVKKLTEELQELRIQIDEAKKERQVAEITNSNYFIDLQARAKEMRIKVKGQDKK
jgi:GAF domain-containing protein